jgi:hypothetical protein
VYRSRPANERDRIAWHKAHLQPPDDPPTDEEMDDMAEREEQRRAMLAEARADRNGGE